MESSQSHPSQTPISVNFSSRLYNTQGLTIDKIILNIGLREFACSLSYVAITRVRTLEDLVFNPFFNYERLAKLHNSAAYALKQKFFQWLSNLSK